MSIQMRIALLIYMFGAGAVAVLATPLAQRAPSLLPAVVVVSAIVAAPIAWLFAPCARVRQARVPHIRQPRRSFED